MYLYMHINRAKIVLVLVKKRYIIRIKMLVFKIKYIIQIKLRRKIGYETAYMYRLLCFDLTHLLKNVSYMRVNMGTPITAVNN